MFIYIDIYIYVYTYTHVCKVFRTHSLTHTYLYKVVIDPALWYSSKLVCNKFVRATFNY